jgi:F0F1-type ATP synthase beta subunit
MRNVKLINNEGTLGNEILQLFSIQIKCRVELMFFETEIKIVDLLAPYCSGVEEN